MTRRERLEARLERRQLWAASRDRKAAAAFNRAHLIADNIPLGQPILVGHHSERHARADQRRIENAMSAGIESQDMAHHHESKASGLERQLDRSIFSDDPDAVEALEAKAAQIDADCDLMKRANAAYRKAKGAVGWSGPLGLSLEAAEALELDVKAKVARGWWGNIPYPTYSLTNKRANARRLRERIKQIDRTAKRTEQAEDSGGVVVAVDGAYCSITFAEKPSRGIIDSLKAHGLFWGGGSWNGRWDGLPATCPTSNGLDLELWDALRAALPQGVPA